jgi:hypothetical protein
VLWVVRNGKFGEQLDKIQKNKQEYGSDAKVRNIVTLHFVEFCKQRKIPLAIMNSRRQAIVRKEKLLTNIGHKFWKYHQIQLCVQKGGISGNTRCPNPLACQISGFH